LHIASLQQSRLNEHFIEHMLRLGCSSLPSFLYPVSHASHTHQQAALTRPKVPAFFHNSYSLLSVKGRNRAKLRLIGTDLPAVDVFITCCKEDPDIILDTARAACAQDYPSSRYRVVVCDDGADPILRQGVEALSLSHPNLYYHARIKVKGKPHHFKAGNLIAATEMVEQLPGGAGEFIAALDADMIPNPDWLRCVIAHMVDEPRMGLVCPPQLFYNIPDNDPLVQSLDAFVHLMEPTKDANGVAWCTGSGYAIRKSALEDIGGWPVGSLAEDVYTSSLLLGKGWKTAFVHEGLQYGTVPDTFTGHLKQRTRWTLGTLQTAIKLNFCLWGPVVKDMTFLQRLSGFVFPAGALFSICLMITLLTIPIVLLSGGTLVAFANSAQLRWQIRLAFISLAFNRVDNFVAHLPSGYRLSQRDAAAHIWMTPYHTMTVLRSFLLPKWLGGKPMAFSSSGSIKSELSERDPANRAPLWRRCVVMIWQCECWMHVLLVLFTLTAVIWSCTQSMYAVRPSRNYTLIYLLTHAFWPPVLWIVNLSAYLTPLLYMLAPPNMPDREDLLDRNAETNVARPKESAKRQRWLKWALWPELQWILCSVYTTIIFVGTFFY
jgi:cellulose synthase/poly-beta-1,6-N-acetylglucosamine synthase-like glycosyltransferase